MSAIYDDPSIQQRPAILEESVSTPPPPRPPVPRRRSRRGRLVAAGIAATVVVALAGASVVPGAPGHGLLTGIVSQVPAGGTAVAASQSQADTQLAAIQQVIQRGNAEQAQAIASQNPSVMSDTATAAHYDQLVQINQQLVAQGVTGIQLTNLAWGPITVNGTTATATSYETWVTTFSDGTTLQSTDTNVYTLVQQGGGWIIQDDQQPNSSSSSGQPPTSQPSPAAPGQPSAPAAPAPAAPQPATVPPAPQAAPAPAAAGAQDTSSNWSGYAATGGQTYTAVTGTWTVPQLSQTGTAGVGATWVGIGGVSSRDLIQAGTQDVAVGSGQSQYQAWIELLPAASQQVPLAVAPGDSVTVSITEQGAGTGVWQIAFKNNTSGQTYQTTVNYTSSQSSAEWIEEAPAGRGGILPLDSFGTIPVSGATAVANGQTVDLAQAGAQPITMLNTAGQPLAVPSAIGSNGSSFSVARTQATATPAPTRGRG
jgi:hypothetical protein